MQAISTPALDPVKHMAHYQAQNPYPRPILICSLTSECRRKTLPNSAPPQAPQLSIHPIPRATPPAFKAIMDMAIDTTPQAPQTIMLHSQSWAHPAILYQILILTHYETMGRQTFEPKSSCMTVVCPCTMNLYAKFHSKLWPKYIEP